MKEKTSGQSGRPGVFSTPTLALEAARAEAGAADLICITGSVFLAGELRPLLLAAQRPE
jgi:hypothetical protein